jgi:diguanylate cyclase (GGDEF)-like protein
MTGQRWLLPLAALVLLASAGLGVSVLVLAPAGALSWAAGGLAVFVVLGELLLVHGFVSQAVGSEEERLALEMSHQCLQEAINALPMGIAIYDQHDRLVMFNPQATEQAPYRDGGELIGQTFETLIRRSLARGSITDALGCEEEWLRERLAGRGQLERPLLRPRADGRWMHLYEVTTPSGCLVMARLDVSELVQKTEALERTNELLEQLSITDALTGLANRRQFDRHLHAEWQRSMRNHQPISLLLIDVDHFKRYNDHYGHVAGDNCLRELAGILYDCAQRSGELVARYGGEEFAVLLPGVESGAAMAVAQRCMEELARARIAHANSPVADCLTCSIGVASVIASPDLVPESLVRSADEALYQVKSSGRAQFGVAPCPA